ncbi:MAG: glycosyltransferase family 2 protein [Blautia sp.]|nr:glycosyltransferase family 2 protein [Blautia sp.]
MKQESKKKTSLHEVLYVVMPAYNEEANIGKVVEEWYPVIEDACPGSRLLIVNDGSKDGTREVLRSLLNKYPRLTVITKKNGGHGQAVLTAYRKAIKSGADYVFQTDSDGQTRPGEFRQLWENRSECGLLIGSRAGRQDGAGRVFVTRTLRMVLLLYYHVWVKDANTPFRLMKAEELKDVLGKIPKTSTVPNILMTVVYTKEHRNVRYFPITFRPRQGGKNSLNVRGIIKLGIKTIKELKVLKRRLR